MKHYRLYSKATYWIYLVIPFVFVVIGIAWVYVALSQPEKKEPVWLLILWLAAAIYGCYWSLRLPYLIEVEETGLIRFVGVQAITVSSQDVISVSRGAQRGRFFELKYGGGKVVVPTFTGFHEFLTELKQKNPNVELRGC